jgi:hypothetical protein
MERSAMNFKGRFQHLQRKFLLPLVVALGVHPVLAGVNTFKSDDFNARNINRTVWTIRDKSSECALQMRYAKTDSARVEFIVPGGSSHEIYPTWGDRSPSLLQTCINENFEAEVKFSSRMTGVGANNYVWEGVQLWDLTGTQSMLRFDFVVGKSAGLEKDSVWARAILLSNYSSGSFANSAVKIAPRYIAAYGQAPLWMRVKRTSTTWEMYASTNGTTFILVGSFAQSFASTRIGPWAGNAGPAPEPFKCGVDYFYNRSALGNGRYVNDTGGPYVHGVRMMTQANSIMLLWKTDEPVDEKVEYGTTTSYGSSVVLTGFFYDHRAVIPGLPPATSYHFRIAGTDDSLHTAMSGDTTATTGEYIIDANLVSDDFNYPTIDTGLWTWVDPRGDGSVSINNKRLSINVPGGVTHNLYTNENFVPRIEQAVQGNANSFDVIVKYATPLVGAATNITSQGIIFEQDAGNLVRACFIDNGTNLMLYADAYTDGLQVPPEIPFGPVAISSPAVPYYLRVTVTAAEYKISWSRDGQNWNFAPGAIVRPFKIKKIELFAGNSGTAPQAYSSLVDRITITLPAKASLVSPANNASDVPAPVSLQWDTCAGAASYTVQLSTDITFATTVFNGSVSTTTKDFPSLATTTRYYWRTRGINAVGSGAFSAIYTFVTSAPAPGVPTLLAPADNAGGLDTVVTLRWSKQTGATVYALQVATDSSFKSGFAINTTITDTFVVVTELKKSTRYYWRVYAGGSGGISPWSRRSTFATAGLVGVAQEAVLPTEFRLEQNYPNPFNPITVISGQWPVVSDVRIVVYDLLGREVAVLVDGQRPAGRYEFEFNASGVASGLYVYRLTAGSFVASRKMMILR